MNHSGADQNPGTAAAYPLACLLSAVGTASWNLMPVLLGSASDALGLTSRQTGAAGAASLAGWLAATVVAVFAIHRVPRRIAVAAASVLAALGFAGAAGSDSAPLLYASLAVGGFGTAVVYCVAIELIAELGDVERAFGAKVGAEVLSGAVLLYTFSALLVPIGGLQAVTIGLALVYLIPLVSTPWVGPRQTRFATEPTALGNRSMWVMQAAIVLALLTFMTGITALWAFLERMGGLAGVGPQSLGWILAAQKLVGGIAAVLALTIGSRLGLGWPHVFGSICIVSAAVMLGHPDGVARFAAAAWIWELGFALSFAYQAAMIARLDSSNRLLLLIPACIGLSGVIGPGIAGFLVRGTDYSSVIMFACACSVIASTIFILGCISLGRSSLQTRTVAAGA